MHRTGGNSPQIQLPRTHHTNESIFRPVARSPDTSIRLARTTGDGGILACALSIQQGERFVMPFHITLPSRRDRNKKLFFSLQLLGIGELVPQGSNGRV